jgi:SAM-dependent methyltransferase
MIRLAREKAPSAELSCGSLHDLKLPRSLAVTAFGEVLNYRADERPVEGRLGNLFRRVAERLLPGGLFVFDVLITGDGPPMAYRSWKSGVDWAVLVEVEEDSEQRSLTRKVIVFREVEGTYRRSEEEHDVSVFDPEEVEALLIEAGLVWDTAEAYGSYGLGPRRRAYFTRRADRGGQSPVQQAPSGKGLGSVL